MTATATKTERTYGTFGTAEIILPANAPEQRWLEMRKTGIGGSDAAAACGLSPYGSPYSLWCEKTGRVPDFEGNTATKWGKILEPVVANEFRDETALTLGDYPGLLRSIEHPWMLASLDRTIIGSNGEPYSLLEVKTANWRQNDEWSEDTNELPAPALVQVQHQLAVTGFDHGWAAGLIGGQSFYAIRVERDQEFIDWLIDAEHAMWEAVTSDEAPDVDGHDATTEAIKARYGAAVPNSEIEIDDPDLWDDLRRAVALEKDAKAALTEVQNRVKDRMGDHSIATMNGVPMATWKTSFPRKFRSKLFKADHPRMHELYVRAGEQRTFLEKVSR